MSDTDSGFDGLFAPEDSPPPHAGTAPDDAWTVLLVDDEPDIQAVLRLALNGTQVLGRPLRLLEAASGAQAREILAREPGVALVLLDVVMESPHAGLDLVRHIREELGNRSVQILLVTGQPGYAPQREVVTGYEINGYRLKSELTAEKIFVSVHAALRAYATLAELERHRSHLEDMVRERTEELARALEAARAADRAKSAFLANMSHELRTPLNAIIGLTGLSLRGDLVPRQRNNLQKVNAASYHLLGLIDEILDFSAIEAGNLRKEPREFDLESVLDTVVAQVGEAAASKDLELVVDVDPDTPRILVGDPLKLGQILLHLCGNAVKFTERGEVSLVVRNQAPEAGRLHLSFDVRDTGIGISEEQRDALFQPFRQIDGSSTRVHGGAGLGLVIARRLAEILGGSIDLESRPGAGSVFTLTVPLQLGSGRSRPLYAPPGTAGRRVLVVDDNDTARMVLAGMLRAMHVEVTAASSGRDAIEQITHAAERGKPIAAVFIDWRMPDLDGIATARQIGQLSLRPLPSLVMVTAYGREEALAEAPGAGIAQVIAKPLTAALVSRALEAIFAKAPAADTAPVAQDPLEAIGRIAGLDMATGLRLARDRATLYLSLLGRFASSQADFALQFDAAVATSDWETAERLAHTLKGTAAQIGAPTIRAEAEMLEHAVRSRRPADEIRHARDRVATDLERLVRSLRDALPPTEP